MTLNETHDPQLRSWVDSANAAGTDFTLQNLPFGVFRPHAGGARRGGVAIGDQILDLSAALSCGALDAKTLGSRAAHAAQLAARAPLNDFMAHGPEGASALRLALSRALRAGSAQQAALQSCLVPQSQAHYALPVAIGDYSDFYTSIHHASAIGRLFRPDQPLTPNYRWLPIAYHGRVSSIGVSGQQFPRPRGQMLGSGATTPSVQPSQRLDYELELGVLVGTGNALGSPIPIGSAESHVFGLCLLNDWSARDLQAWEYQPLGPFLGKSFATTISPWIVTLEALAPYRTAWARPAEDPQPLAYLDSPEVRAAGAIDIQLQVALQSERMRGNEQAPEVLSRSNFEYAYWTIAQMLAHHTINGCNLEPGDLLGTGTQSGPAPNQAGSLLELSRGGKAPVSLANGERRAFLEDGDVVVMRGWSERPGRARVGFGELCGRVLPARA